MIRRRLIVSGRVQGVYFRVATAEQARMRDLAGWVRNRPDGTVEAEVEGPADAVDALIAWAHDGPPDAAVVDVEVTELEPGGDVGFEIR